MQAVVGPVGQRKPAAIRPQPGEALDEDVLRQIQKGGNGPRSPLYQPPSHPPASGSSWCSAGNGRRVSFLPCSGAIRMRPICNRCVGIGQAAVTPKKSSPLRAAFLRSEPMKLLLPACSPHLLCPSVCPAAPRRNPLPEPRTEPTGGSIAADKDAKTTVHYLLALPPASEATPAGGYPLMVFMHGAGERGTDRGLVKKHGPPKLVGKRPGIEQFRS